MVEVLITLMLNGQVLGLITDMTTCDRVEASVGYGSSDLEVGVY